MILPTKGIEEERALLALGADLVRLLTEPMTVSRLWELFQSTPRQTRVTFDWFVLSLDLLFALGALEMNRGRLIVQQRP